MAGDATITVIGVEHMATRVVRDWLLSVAADYDAAGAEAQLAAPRPNP